MARKKITKYEAARIYLAKYRATVSRIEHLLRCIKREEERIAEEYGSLQAFAPSETGIHTYATGDPTVLTAIRIEDNMTPDLKDLTAQHCQLEYEKEEMDKLINTIPWGERERQVVELLYMRQVTLKIDDAAKELHYAKSSIYNFERSAVSTLALFMPDTQDCSI